MMQISKSHKIAGFKAVVKYCLALACLCLFTLPYSSLSQLPSVPTTNTPPQPTIVSSFDAGPPQPQFPVVQNNLPAVSGNVNQPITTKITKFPDFYRVEFESANYVSFTPTIEGDLLTIDFVNPPNISAALFGRNLDIVRAYGESDDGRSITLRLSVGDLKLRRFISDNFTTGFDLFFDRKIAAKRNIIYKTQTVDGNIQTTIEQPDIAGSNNKPLQPVRKFVPKNRIIVFPKTFIGPPAISQLFKLPDNFIGPPPTDFSKNTIYEVERTQSSTELTVESEANPNGITLRFPFTNLPDVAAAALWQRGNKLIIVFNTPINLDLERVTDKNYIKDIKQFPSKDNTILIIDNYTEAEKKYRGTLDITMYKSNSAWNLDILQQADNTSAPSKKADTLSVLSENFWGENRVTIQKTPFQKPIDYFDSESGEKLIFFPSKEGSIAIQTPREFVDFKIPKSIQGAIIDEKSDFLDYNVTDNKVEITKLPNLVLSEEILSQDLTTASGDDLSSANKVKGIFPEQSILPFKKSVEAEKNTKKSLEDSKTKKDDASKDEHADKPKEAIEAKLNYYQRRIKYQQDYANTDKAALPQLKMDYASWLFENGLYPESRAVVDDIIKSTPDFPDLLKAKTMRAATDYMSHHYQEAFDELTKLVSGLDNNTSYNEIKLWQWASNHRLLEQDNKYDDGNIKIDFISSYDKFMQQYPDDLKTELGLMYVEDKISKNQLNEAKNLMEIITYRGVPEGMENSVSFLGAKIDSLLGNIDSATKTYEELIKDIDDRKNRAYAGFELIKQKLITNQISIDDALKGLESLSFIWRDDYFEVDLYELIGQLYLAENRFYDALYAWKNIATNFPNTADSIVVLGKMKKVYIDLFDGGVAYKMKPLEALNIYFTFRELMPVGELGDSISRKFANYLMKTDLPEDAIRIVEHQVKFRSEGDERNKLALQLADMYIRNGEFNKVDEALKYIDTNTASKDVKNQIKYHRANILAMNGDYDRSLTILKDDFSYDAMSVRMQLFWQRENWFGLINIIENRLQEMNDTRPDPLTAKETDQLLKLAVAYSAQEEFTKLKALEDTFRSRLQDPEDLRLFDFLSMRDQRLDPSNFESTLQLDDIESFVNEYNYLPLKNWTNAIQVLEPKVAKLVGTPNESLTRQNQLDILRLASAYILINKKDERETNDFNKRLNLLARDFKDVRLDRTNIDALYMLDNRTQPIESDAIFEGRIKLTDLARFLPLYQRSHKISELNINTRAEFK